MQSFFAMLEMASVSFNRIRLNYFIYKKNRRAIWLSRLLKNPLLLFGTTLIGVNGAMQFGSECARRFYISIGLSPDFAPLSQVFLVLMFSELAPLFAARRYAEHVVMLGTPLLYLTSLVLRPVIYLLQFFVSLINRLVGGSKATGLSLSREELQKAIEEKDQIFSQEGKGGSDSIPFNIFSLKNKTAKDLMAPIQFVEKIAAEVSVKEFRMFFRSTPLPFVPLFEGQINNIVAVAYPRDFLRLDERESIRPYCRSPWFIMEKNSVLQILKEFRSNNESVAIVLNDRGASTGILTLDDVVDEILGQRDEWVSLGEFAPEKHRIFIDRSYLGETLVSEINEELRIDLEGEEGESLEEFMTRHLGHHPGKGDSIRFKEFELSLEESSLAQGKKIYLRSI